MNTQKSLTLGYRQVSVCLVVRDSTALVNLQIKSMLITAAFVKFLIVFLKLVT